MARASEITCCVFVETPASKVFNFDASGNFIESVNFDALTQDELSLYQFASNAFGAVADQQGAFKYQVWICPLDYEKNAPTAYKEFNTFPSILITAKYPNGTARKYAIPKGLTGAIPNSSEIQPYIKALLLEKFGDGEKSVLCQAVPLLCNVPRWMWLALAGWTTFEGLTSEGLRKAGYLGAAVLSWNEFSKRGGFNGGN